MLGPALYVKGGISALEKMIIPFSDSEVSIEMLPTMHDLSLLGRFRHFGARIFSWPVRSVYRRPDIVHIHMSHGLSTLRKLLLLRLWKISRVPVILHMHSSSFTDFFNRSPRILRWWISRGFYKADRVICLSESWKNYYSSITDAPEGNFLIMPNPAPLPTVGKETEQTAKQTVLFSGRVGSRKGTFDLIEAWSKLPLETLRKSSLIIAGDGDITAVRKLTESLSESCDINVVGWVSDEKLRDLFRKSSIYVLPSRAEGVPIGIMEAMSYGSAIITTPVGGIPELISDGQNGIFVKPGSVAEITRALQKLITDEKLRFQLSSEAMKTAESRGINNYMENLKRIWRSIGAS